MSLLLDLSKKICEKLAKIDDLKRLLPFCSRMQNCFLRDVEVKRKSCRVLWTNKCVNAADCSAALMSCRPFFELNVVFQVAWSCNDSATFWIVCGINGLVILNYGFYFHFNFIRQMQLKFSINEIIHVIAKFLHQSFECWILAQNSFTRSLSIYIVFGFVW